jgi:hypothetical protein
LVGAAGAGVDGESAIGQWRRRQTVLTEQAHAFCGVLGANFLICDPGDPEAKGLVERANGYLEISFLPGRSFASPAEFNAFDERSTMRCSMVQGGEQQPSIVGRGRPSNDAGLQTMDRLAGPRESPTSVQHGSTPSY